MFYEAVENDLANSKETSFNNTISSTLCCKPPRYVPYKGTYVPYDDTYGTSDQGQMLDMQGSQTAESALT